MNNDENLKPFLNALTKNPNGFAENYNLGIMFHKKGSLERSIKFFTRAAEIEPKNPQTFNDLGTVYMDMDDPEKALLFLQKAVRIDNKFSDAYYNIGLLYSQYKSKTKLAKKYYKKAYKLDLKNSKALAMYFQTIRGSCNFDLKEKLSSKLDELTAIELKNKEEVGETPFFHLTRKQDEEENFNVAKNWAKRKTPLSRNISHQARGDMLRVGYLSDGLRDFPTGHNFSAVLANHSKSIHLNVYFWGQSDNSIYEKMIKRRADNYVNITNLNDFEAAEKIRSDNIHCLVDLKGFTKNNRMKIFSLKPSPVQINYLGYPGTSGSSYHDYLISDNIAIPESARQHFSEKIIYMGHCYRPGDVTTKFNLKNKNSGKFIFASINSTYKINREIFETWMKIIKQTDNSELRILIEDKQAQKNIINYAAKCGVSASRIKFMDFMDKNKHLERLSKIDLCLDTSVASGHTTTTDAARVGVPVLAVQGSHLASRVSESVLHNLGMENLITKNMSDYKKKAIKLATDKKYYLKTKTRLISEVRKSIIFDPVRFAKSLEKVYFAL